jgi:probable addiction module antidote protein
MTKPRGKLKTYKWDPARHIKTEKDVAAYLEAAFEDGDPSIITEVLGDIARSQGMTKLAKRTGLGRESLYKALSRDGNPRLDTLLRITRALGLRLTFRADAA